jgi:hypothetical protein
MKEMNHETEYLNAGHPDRLDVDRHGHAGRGRRCSSSGTCARSTIGADTGNGKGIGADGQGDAEKRRKNAASA